jgi:release factor glutamine methyltransferase
MSMSASEWTVLSMIQWASAYFAERGVDSPRLTIELLLTHVLGVSRMRLYMMFDRPLSASELDALRPMVRRRGKREPLQYITGTAHFFGLELAVHSAVLIPRPETEILVEHALKHALRIVRRHASESSESIEHSLERPALTVLDIGTGSGCILIALANALTNAVGNTSTKAGEMVFVGADVSEPALELARENAAALLNVPASQLASQLSFVRADALAESFVAEVLAARAVGGGFDSSGGLSPSGLFDLIVSNPPYIGTAAMAELEPEVANHEPQIALSDGGTGLRFYERFAEIFPALLSERGVFAVEIGFGERDAVEALFRAAGFVVRTEPDLAGIPRVVMGWRASAESDTNAR